MHLLPYSSRASRHPHPLPHAYRLVHPSPLASTLSCLVLPPFISPSHPNSRSCITTTSLSGRDPIGLFSPHSSRPFTNPSHPLFLVLLAGPPLSPLFRLSSSLPSCLGPSWPARSSRLANPRHFAPQHAERPDIVRAGDVDHRRLAWGHTRRGKGQGKLDCRMQ
jgi:hypothetical protein